MLSGVQWSIDIVVEIFLDFPCLYLSESYYLESSEASEWVLWLGENYNERSKGLRFLKAGKETDFLLHGEDRFPHVTGCNCKNEQDWPEDDDA